MDAIAIWTDSLFVRDSPVNKFRVLACNGYVTVVRFCTIKKGPTIG